MFEITWKDNDSDLNDSDLEDPYESDEGFPPVNIKGRSLEMRVSKKLRPDFEELCFTHLSGPLWDILAGTNRYTKLSDSELRHEGTRNL